MLAGPSTSPATHLLHRPVEVGHGQLREQPRVRGPQLRQHLAAQLHLRQPVQQRALQNRKLDLEAQ